MEAGATLALTKLRRRCLEPIAVQTAVGRLACVHVANRFVARCLGLLNRERLADDEGLLFVPGGSIHTLGMRFAIDVVFLDARFMIIKVKGNVKPWRFAFAPARTQFVLELGANRSFELGIVTGRAIELRQRAPAEAYKQFAAPFAEQGAQKAETELHEPSKLPRNTDVRTR